MSAKKPKMTDWFPPGTDPLEPGEYNASVERNPYIKRLWDGDRWSFPYIDSASEADKARARRARELKRVPIHWRGLASNPNKATGSQQP